MHDFLTDLRAADRSHHTICAYEGDVRRYGIFCADSSSATSVETLRAFFASRVSEALGLYGENLDLTTDDEHLRVKGKSGRQRTQLLDDPALVRQLRTYLRKAGYQHGPLMYQSIQKRWAGP